MLGTHHCDRTIFPPDVSPLLKLMPPCPDATSVLISQSNSKANGITCPCVNFSSLSQKKKKKQKNFFCEFFKQTENIFPQLFFFYKPPPSHIYLNVKPQTWQCTLNCTCFPSFLSLISALFLGNTRKTK